MRIRSVLVHVEVDSTSSDARLQLAAGLARRLDATLIGLAAGEVQPLPVGDPYGGAFVDGEILEANRQEIRDELEKAKELFAASPGCETLLTEWRSAVGVPAECIAQESRAADLIVIGRDLERLRLGPYRSADPGDVMMRAGRPTLVVPPGKNSLDTRRIVIAWKDTREARRAVWDAMPFLAAAESVCVLEVTERDDLETAVARASDVVAYLARHEVNAKAEVRTRRESTVADELILVAEQQNAELIVAGGYGHARLREWVLGGVTRDLLRHSPKCCLLSH